jgi:hypothetical protein
MLKRKWFQLHLSTLLIVSLAAGAVLWLNLRAFTVEQGGYDLWNCGWPYPMYEIQLFIIDCMFDANETLKDSTLFLPGNLAKNIGVGLAILLCVAVLCESWTRRKAAVPGS